jgi:GMP synthase (glutamine-hydrolysing)
MSHGDQLSTTPPDFGLINATKTAPFAAIAHDSNPFSAIQKSHILACENKLSDL